MCACTLVYLVCTREEISGAIEFATIDMPQNHRWNIKSLTGLKLDSRIS